MGTEVFLTYKQYFTLTDEWQRFQVYKGNSSIFVALTRAGDTSLETLTRAYVTMPQYEEGTKATSYIPNSFSNGTSTRTADTNVQTGDISQYLNQSEGVLEVDVKRIASSDSGLITLGGSSTSEGVIYLAFTNSSIFMHFFKSGVYNQSTSYSVDTVSDFLNIKFSWFSGGVKIKVNDAEVYVGTQADPILPTNSKLHLKSVFSTDYFLGSIKSIKIYDSINDY